jgi:hypothetical protein
MRKLLTPEGTMGAERTSQYFYADIQGVGISVEIAELRAQKKNLQERLEKIEQKKNQQIIPIQFLESEELELKTPIIVSLYYSEEGGGWIVDCPELNLYGEGEDERQAIDDFKNALEEFYFSLKKDKGTLGPGLRRIWGILQKIVEEKSR